MKTLNKLLFGLTLAALTTSAFAMKRSGPFNCLSCCGKRRKLNTDEPTAPVAQTPSLTTTNAPTQTTTQSSSSSSSSASTLATTMASSGSSSSSSSSSTQSTSLLLNLPRELIMLTLGNLDGQGLSTAAKTCRALNTLLRSMQVQINRFDRINPSITYMEAARHGNIQLFRMLCPIIQLIEQGHDLVLSQQDTQNINTIFKFSAMNGYINLLSFLLSHHKIAQAIEFEKANQVLYIAMFKQTNLYPGMYNNKYFDIALLVLKNPTLYQTIFSVLSQPYDTALLDGALNMAAMANRADIVKLLLDGYTPTKKCIQDAFERAQRFNNLAVIHLLQTHQKTQQLIRELNFH
jgi:hypothetical protein